MDQNQNGLIMPDCYLLAVAQASSLDVGTNNYSLFGLIEEVQMARAGDVPLEVHVYWQFAPDELNIPFEMRLRLEDDAGESYASEASQLVSATARLRGRALGLSVPKAGSWKLVVDWRPSPGAEWQTVPIRWPFNVVMSPISNAPIVSPPTS